MKSCWIYQAKRGHPLLARRFVSARKCERFPFLLRSTNDPTISHLHQTTLAFANPNTGVGEGSRSHRVRILMKIDCSTFYLTSYPDLLSASSTRDLGTRLPFTAITKPFFALSVVGGKKKRDLFHLVSRLNESKPSEQNSKANTAMIIFSQEFLVKPLKKKTLMIFSSLKTLKAGTARSTSITHQSRLTAWQIWTNLTRF